MVEIDLVYEGQLRSTARHTPSGTTLVADAPVDNHGRGESFSPTDLVATALGSCMLTYIGLAADKHGWDVVGTRISVKKEMVADPLRRIGRLIVDITLNRDFDDKELKILTNAVTTCPVKLSVSDRIEVPITFKQ
ncbi:MAG: OsmC family peroxiredoxin [Ignavibacteriae bacterium]|nr:MAG: OsmC family peroxiredoxin [Ignavibacteriota bacterium]